MSEKLSPERVDYLRELGQKAVVAAGYPELMHEPLTVGGVTIMPGADFLLDEKCRPYAIGPVEAWNELPQGPLKEKKRQLMSLGVGAMVERSKSGQ